MKNINEVNIQEKATELLIKIVEPSKAPEETIKSQIKANGIDEFLNNVDSMNLPTDVLEKLRSLSTIIKNVNSGEGRDLD